jgi:hypothetical protein
VCSPASIQGNGFRLFWGRMNGCPWSKATGHHAATNGDRLITCTCCDGCGPMTARPAPGTGSGAHAIGQRWLGHLEVLQWARANGCPWDKLTSWAAGQGGRLDVLEWVHANSCLTMGCEPSTVRPRSAGGAPASAAVVARERLPLGCAHVQVCSGERRPSGCARLVAHQLMAVPSTKSRAMRVAMSAESLLLERASRLLLGLLPADHTKEAAAGAAASELRIRCRW